MVRVIIGEEEDIVIEERNPIVPPVSAKRTDKMKKDYGKPKIHIETEQQNRSPNGSRIEYRRLSVIPQKEVSYLWDNRFLLGKVNLLAGLGGVTKSISTNSCRLIVSKRQRSKRDAKATVLWNSRSPMEASNSSSIPEVSHEQNDHNSHFAGRQSQTRNERLHRFNLPRSVTVPRRRPRCRNR